MGESFILDYLILVFFGSCGVFQAAATLNGLRGLMPFRSPAVSFLLGIALLAGAFTWFFVSEPRNLPDTGAGLTGNEQFGYLFAGGGAGLAFTLLVTSIRNSRLGEGLSDMPQDIDALTKSNYLRVLHRTFKLWAGRDFGAKLKGSADEQHPGTSNRRHESS
jgi:hypothetical protein